MALTDFVLFKKKMYIEKLSSICPTLSNPIFQSFLSFFENFSAMYFMYFNVKSFKNLQQQILYFFKTCLSGETHSFIFSIISPRKIGDAKFFHF
jgi:hypothetical protein